MRLVPRSFTRIPESSREAPVSVECLDQFRDARAYVLLGAPGSGKSTVFRREAERSHACFVTARDFICLDRPEWRKSTLFIDGLDEVRVGSSDPRTPLDQIRAKLSRPDCPKFRISCRDGGWLGSNDREAFRALTDGGDVPVFRLNPLGTEKIWEVLKEELEESEAKRVLDGAVERGLQQLLGNPLTLTLLARALSGSKWPQNRTDALALGSEALSTEQNGEHLVATLHAPSRSEVLKAAEQLCAFQLLTGRTGWSRVGGSADQDYLSPDDLDHVDPDALNLALGSRIFESPGVPGRLAPIHRLVAEFLAARHLAQLVDKGLPVGRILSLVCGFDGRVVSEFSGVTAWLAALCKTSRMEIMDRDPLGTLMNGDVKEFSPDEKHALINCVAGRPWRRDDYYRLIANGDARLGDLATPDMDSVFRGYLQDPVDNDVGLRATLLVVRSLQWGAAVSGLASDLLQVVRNDQWHRIIRFHALGALCTQSAGDDQAAWDSIVLLEDLANGDVHDEDDELLGLLLDSLYPSVLCATDIVRFIKAPKAPNLYGTYKSFWNGLSSREMTTQQLGDLLDALRVAVLELNARFKGREADREIVSRVPGSLLARYLETAPIEPIDSRLYDWLELSFNYGLRFRFKDKRIIQAWLSSHPNNFQAVIEHGIRRCIETVRTEECLRRFGRILDDLDSPAELVGWLHQQSLIARDPVVERVLRQLSQRGVQPVTAIEQQTESEDRDIGLAESVEELALQRPIRSEPPPREAAAGDHGGPWHEEWRAKVRENLEALRSSQCSPALLNALAHAYFDKWSLLDGETPRERLRALLADEDLVNAALCGLRGAVHRTDAPTPKEIADLVKNDTIHPLARPFLAGMAEIEHMREKPEEILGPRQVRTVLAFHFVTPFVDPQPYRTDERRSADRDTPLWYQQLVESECETVAEVLVKMARAEISKGLVLFHVLHRMETSPDHGHVARLACLPILRSIPVRSNSTQTDGLACLLRAAILHCNGDDLLSLIDQKLGRSSMHAGQKVCWLTAGLFLRSEKYREELVKSLSVRETLVRSVVDFVVGPSALPSWKPPFHRLDSKSVECLILAAGRLFNPLDGGVLQIRGPILVDGLIKQLSENPSHQATHSLSRLSQSAELKLWRPQIQEGQSQQTSIRRSVSFRYMSTRELRQTLYNQQPASAADLAAMTTNHLETIAKRVRDGNTSGWCQYWDCAGGKFPLKPRHEELCRDLLLSKLRSRLERLEIDAQPEGRYADDKRADIRVAYRNRFNVPVEIKKSNHRGLWTSIREQLVEKYTRDPGCDGYGIYAVLWFGSDGVVPSPAGKRPSSAEALKEALVRSLGVSERLKLSIVVIDVAEPRS